MLGCQGKKATIIGGTTIDFVIYIHLNHSESSFCP